MGLTSKTLVVLPIESNVCALHTSHSYCQHGFKRGRREMWRLSVRRWNQIHWRLESERTETWPRTSSSSRWDPIRWRICGWSLFRFGLHVVSGWGQIRRRIHARLVSWTRHILASGWHEVRGRISRRPNMGSGIDNVSRFHSWLSAQRGILSRLPIDTKTKVLRRCSAGPESGFDGPRPM